MTQRIEHLRQRTDAQLGAFLYETHRDGESRLDGITFTTNRDGSVLFAQYVVLGEIQLRAIEIAGMVRFGRYSALRVFLLDCDDHRHRAIRRFRDLKTREVVHAC